MLAWPVCVCVCVCVLPLVLPVGRRCLSRVPADDVNICVWFLEEEEEEEEEEDV